MDTGGDFELLAAQFHTNDMPIDALTICYRVGYSTPVAYLAQ